MNTVGRYKKYVNTAMVDKVQPVVIEKASGASITDTQGKEYIDCFSGIAVAKAGHGNEKVVEAAQAQIDKLIHCCSYVYYSQPTAELAEKLAQISPGRLQKTFFGNAGSGFSKDLTRNPEEETLQSLKGVIEVCP